VSETSASEQPALIRHIIPVVVGGFVTLLLTVVTDSSLAAHGLLPSLDRPVFETGPLALIAGYRGLFTIVGCHVAARLAPRGNPRIRYALALGGVLFAMSVAGASTIWGKVPMWFALSGIALTIPYAIIGGATAARAMMTADHRA
jgi:hypothetical protein